MDTKNDLIWDHLFVTIFVHSKDNTHTMIVKYIWSLYKILLIKMINLLPNNFEEEVYNQLIRRSENLRRCAARYIYSPDILDVKRFDISDVISAVGIAKKKFPDCKLYLISDHPNDYVLDGVEMFMNTDEIDDIDEIQVFICAFESDQKLIKVLKNIIKLTRAYFIMPNVYYPTARYFHKNDLAKKVLLEERNINKPKFEICDFENLLQAVEITKYIDGDYLEIGVYQGRSAHLVLNYLKQANIDRKCYFIDIFEGFTYKEAEKSSDMIWKGTHTETSIWEVKEFVSEFCNVEILQLNIINDDIPNMIKKIALCNIDVDLYEAVVSSVNKVAPLVVVGGIIILEDQGHTPALGGACLATHDFLDSKISKDFMPIHMASGQMLLIKVSDSND